MQLVRVEMERRNAQAARYAVGRGDPPSDWFYSSRERQKYELEKFHRG